MVSGLGAIQFRLCQLFRAGMSSLNSAPASKRLRTAGSLHCGQNSVDGSRTNLESGRSDAAELSKLESGHSEVDGLVRLESSQSEASVCVHFGSPSALDIPERLLYLELEQTRAIRALSFGPPVSTVYHPIEYACEPHSAYVRRYCRSGHPVLLVGMNPGPFGMVQTGVPFGDTRIVRGWLGLTGEVRKPDDENSKRPILGLQCERSEVSGTRFWNFIRSISKNDDPQSFFKNCYVHNYCPAAFIDWKGKNITPPTLKKSELIGLEAVCDEYLEKAVELLGAKVVVGIGVYAYQRCRRVLNGKNGEIRVEMIMHPSPANPATNTGGGWPVKVRQQLETLDLLRHITA